MTGSTFWAVMGAVCLAAGLFPARLAVASVAGRLLGFAAEVVIRYELGNLA